MSWRQWTWATCSTSPSTAALRTMKNRAGLEESDGEGRKSLVKEMRVPGDGGIRQHIMSDPARNAYLAGRVERITDRTIWALAEQVKKGDFEPVGL